MSNPDHMKEPALTRLEECDHKFHIVDTGFGKTQACMHCGIDGFVYQQSRRYQGPVGTGSYTSLLEENKRMREALEMFVHDWHKTGNPIKAYLLARSLTQGESK